MSFQLNSYRNLASETELSQNLSKQFVKRLHNNFLENKRP